MIDVHFVCRECGTPCDPIAAQERGGVCPRCAFPTRVTVQTHSLRETPHAFINGREVIGREAIEAALAQNPNDPMKRAIDRALTAWARDEFKDEGKQ